MSATKKPKLAKTKIALVQTTTDPMPNLLSKECGAGLKISFDGILGEFTSEFGGSFTYAKRIAMAYAAASRTKNTWTGIGCVDLTEAFQIISFEPDKMRIVVKLTEKAQTMEFTAPDLSFLNQPRPTAAAMFGYSVPRRYDYW